MLKSLDTIRNLNDPLKMFVSTWNFVTPTTGPLKSIIEEMSGNDGNKNVELRCQTYTFPTFTGDQTVVQWGGFERRYAGKQHREGNWSVTFTEIWSSGVTEAFKKWLNVYHQYKEGKITLLKDYTTEVNINLVNPDVYDASTEPSTQTRYDIKLYDVFPTSVTFPQIDASASDPVDLTVEFSYNYFLCGDEIPNNS